MYMRIEYVRNKCNYVYDYIQYYRLVAAILMRSPPSDLQVDFATCKFNQLQRSASDDMQLFIIVM